MVKIELLNANITSCFHALVIEVDFTKRRAEYVIGVAARACFVDLVFAPAHIFIELRLCFHVGIFKVTAWRAACYRKQNY